MSNENKKRVAIHEAGHVTFNLLWGFPVAFAEINENHERQGTYKGVTRTDRFKIIDNHKSFFVKQLCVSFSGSIAEEIYLGREIDWKVESQGSVLDFYNAQTEGFKFMAEKFYTDQFAPHLLKLTKDALVRNWSNSVIIIANCLFERGRVTPEFIKRNIRTLYKPNRDTIDQIVNRTHWLS